MEQVQRSGDHRVGGRDEQHRERERHQHAQQPARVAQRDREQQRRCASAPMPAIFSASDR